MLARGGLRDALEALLGRILNPERDAHLEGARANDGLDGPSCGAIDDGVGLVAEERHPKTETHVIGIELAKSVFSGSTARRRAARPCSAGVCPRGQLERFMAAQPPCAVAMEACASAHHWARRMAALGHQVRLIAPAWVRPFARRPKTDAADAEAIVEAAMRPTMRVNAPKSAEAQARAMLFRAREQVIKQRTETVNALRGHLAEFGLVAPAGIGHVPRLAALLEDEGGRDARARPRDGAAPPRARCAAVGRGRSAHPEDRRGRAASPAARLLRTMPGVGAIAAMAVETVAPDLASLARGRDFAAWLGLTPREHSSSGRQRLGRTSKMGQRDVRRLLIIGAMSRIASARRHPGPMEPWLRDKLERKPRRMVAAIAEPPRWRARSGRC